MSQNSSSTVPYILSSKNLRETKAYREFPWLNGIVLEEGSLESYVNKFAENFQGDNDAYIAIKSIAQNLDLYNPIDSVHNPTLRKVMRSFNDSDRKGLANLEAWRQTKDMSIFYATHPVFKFCLLDRLLDAFGFPRSTELKAVERQQIPELAGKFGDRFLKALSDWQKPISVVLGVQKSITGSSEPVGIFAQPLPMQPTIDQLNIKAISGIILRATQSHQSSQLNRLVYNFELLALGMIWYGLNQQIDIENEEENWVKSLISRAKSANAAFDDGFIQILENNETKKLFFTMRILFHLCVSISPMMALHTQQFHSVRRDQVIATAVCLGNCPPKCLLETERLLWKCIFSVMRGSSGLAELSNFIQGYQALAAKFSDNNLEKDWFSISRDSMKAIEKPGQEQPQASTSKLPASQPPASQRPASSQGAKTRSQLSRGSPSKVPPSRTSVSSPSKHHRRRRSGKEKGNVVAGDQESDKEVMVSNEEPEEEPRRRRSEKGKGKEPARSNEPAPSSSSSSDHGRSDDDEPGKGALMIYKRTRSHSRAVEEEKRAVHEKLVVMAGRSIKKVNGTPMRTAKMVQSVIIDLTGDEPSHEDVTSFEPPRMHRTGHKVTLFDADPGNKAIQHTFHAPSNTSTLEYNCLKKVMSMVESKYQNGVPLHHLPSAKERNRQANQSSIFVVEWKDFNEMEAHEIQNIFRHRHILVRNWPEKTLKFDRAGLSMLGPMHKQSSFQVGELKGKRDRPHILRRSSLDSFLKASGENPLNVRVLNGLDFHLGHLSLPPYPQIRSLDSGELAWHLTRGIPGFRVERNLKDDTTWGLAGTKGTTSLTHIDDDGLAAVVRIMAGSKYWVVMNSREPTDENDHAGDLKSIDAFPLDFSYGDSGAGYFEGEGVLLTTGDVFYMRPNTPHYVLGVENTITFGRHFYAASTISDTCYGIIHSFMLNAVVTNQQHDETRTFLRRLMSMWQEHYMEEDFEIDDFVAHIPDVTTSTGLLDIVMVGNILEFADALSRPFYTGKAPKDVSEEERVAQWRYRLLIRWISKKFILVFNNAYVNPWYLVHMSIAQFAATLCAYMETWKMKGNDAKGCTPKKFRLAVINHLRRQWVELIPKFDQLQKDKPSSTFSWDGPEFQVVNRKELSEEALSSEVMDLENYRVSVAEIDDEDELVGTEKDSESDLTEIESEKEEQQQPVQDNQDPEGEEERPEEEGGNQQQEEQEKDDPPAEEEKDEPPAAEEKDDEQMEVDEGADAGSKSQTSKLPTENKRRTRSQSNTRSPVKRKRAKR